MATSTASPTALPTCWPLEAMPDAMPWSRAGTPAATAANMVGNTTPWPKLSTARPGTRYAEIRSAIPGLSDTLLSQRLDELADEGLIERRVVPESPVRVEYHLTPKGAALERAVEAISDWAEEWLPMPSDQQPARAADQAAR